MRVTSRVVLDETVNSLSDLAVFQDSGTYGGLSTIGTETRVKEFMQPSAPAFGVVVTA